MFQYENKNKEFPLWGNWTNHNKSNEYFESEWLSAETSILEWYINFDVVILGGLIFLSCVGRFSGGVQFNSWNFLPCQKQFERFC